MEQKRGIRTVVSGILGQDPRMKERSAAADYIRLAALLGLIITHTLSLELDINPTIQGKHYVVLQILSMMGNVCNVLYIMLSGAFLYRYRDESAWSFYKKRFSMVVLPMFVYYVVYLYRNQMLQAGTTMQDLLGYANAFIRGEVTIAPHYWLMYQILCIYVTVPFFRGFLKAFSYDKLTEMCGIFLFFMTMNRVLMKLDMYTIVNVMFPEWLMISIMGYWIMQNETRKYDRILMGAGIGAAAVLVAIYFRQWDLSYYIQNQSPVKILMGAGICACCIHFKGFHKSNAIIRLLAKYNFGMTLIHWASLIIIRGQWGLSIVDGGYAGGILRNVLLNLLVSLALSMVIDNLLVLPIRSIPGILGKMLKKQKKGSKR